MTALNRLPRPLMVAFVLAAAAASGSLGADGGRPATTAPSAQVTVVERDGFDWADAGVGALGAVGVMFVVGGVAIVVRYGRRQPLAVLSGLRDPTLRRAHRRAEARRKRRLS